MTSKEESDRFALEASRRFDEFTTWMTEHWPRKDLPLMHSDFDASRRELAQLLGPRLGDVPTKGTSTAGADDNPQYVSANPMPWP